MAIGVSKNTSDALLDPECVNVSLLFKNWTDFTRWGHLPINASVSHNLDFSWNIFLTSSYLQNEKILLSNILMLRDWLLNETLHGPKFSRDSVAEF